MTTGVWFEDLELSNWFIIELVWQYTPVPHLISSIRRSLDTLQAFHRNVHDYLHRNRHSHAIFVVGSYFDSFVRLHTLHITNCMERHHACSGGWGFQSGGITPLALLLQVLHYNLNTPTRINVRRNFGTKPWYKMSRILSFSAVVQCRDSAVLMTWCICFVPIFRRRAFSTAPKIDCRWLPSKFFSPSSPLSQWFSQLMAHWTCRSSAKNAEKLRLFAMEPVAQYAVESKTSLKSRHSVLLMSVVQNDFAIAM